MNILEEKGISKEKLEEMLSRYVSKEVEIIKYEVKPFKEGFKHDVYKLPITYIQKKNSSTNNILLVAKVSKVETEDYYGENQEGNEILYGSTVAELLQQNEYIAKLVGVSSNRDTFLMEYLG